MPIFNLETDQVAYDILKEHYPNRKIIKINNARDIILGRGNIHCITQQIIKLSFLII